MKVIRRLALVSGVLVALAGCCPNPSFTQKESEPDLIQYAGRREFGAGGTIGMQETIGVAKLRGFNYVDLVAKAQKKEPAALKSLFWLSKHGGLDAASAQGHATVMGMLLSELGDDFFSIVLKEVSVEIRLAVANDINYELWSEEAPIRSIPFLKRFPNTYALSFPIGEQVQNFVGLCRREVRDWQPDYEVAKFGVQSLPYLIPMLNDNRKTWVRIGPPKGGPSSHLIDVEYLFADDEGQRSSIAEFAYLCMLNVRDQDALWQKHLSEFTNYDGTISKEAQQEMIHWAEGQLR